MQVYQHPLLGQRLHAALADTIFESQIRAEMPIFLAHHQVFGTTIFPAAAYLEMALVAVLTIYPSAQLQAVTISKALILKDQTEKTLQLIVTPSSAQTYTWQIFSRDTAVETLTWTLHTAGKMLAVEHAVTPRIDLAGLRSRLTTEMSAAVFYSQCQARGLDYGHYFQAVIKLWHQGTEVLGFIRLPETLEINGYTVHPVLLDACFQLLVAILPEDSNTYLPVGLKNLQIFQPLLNVPLWGYARLDTRTLSADIQLATETGTVLVAITGLQWKKARREKLFG